MEDFANKTAMIDPLLQFLSAPLPTRDNTAFFRYQDKVDAPENRKPDTIDKTITKDLIGGRRRRRKSRRKPKRKSRKRRKSRKKKKSRKRRRRKSRR